MITKTYFFENAYDANTFSKNISHLELETSVCGSTVVIKTDEPTHGYLLEKTKHSSFYSAIELEGPSPEHILDGTLKQLNESKLKIEIFLTYIRNNDFSEDQIEKIQLVSQNIASSLVDMGSSTHYSFQ